MARKVRDRQKKDAQRTSPRVMNARASAPPPEPADAVAERLRRERDDAIAKLRDLGLTPEMGSDTPRDVGPPVLDEGDAAQATERMDMSLAARQRLAERINRLTAALERLHEGTYGTCEQCGRSIEPARLEAMPEAPTCLACQAQAERDRRGPTAA
jgi:RNA polymerase-binding protein DksA